jgi:hypothetical protein
MIERAIENWLTSTNERNYKAAFVQVLAHQGYNVLTVPADGPMEQGKDLITIDPDGHPCGFQLKTGELNLAAWRKYREEMMELIQFPIYHPGIDKQIVHRAVLVANGEMTNEVRVQIDQINADNVVKDRKYAKLEVVTLRPLLRDFIEAQGAFIPREVSDFRAFLEMYQADGTDFFPVEKFVNLVDGVFLKASDRPSDLKNAIAASLIFTSYILHPFQLVSNHYAAFEAWTALGACLLRFALRKKLDLNVWKMSFDLIQAEIVRNLLDLRAEALERPDFLEGVWVGDGGPMHSVRAMVTLGACAAVTTHLQYKGIVDPVSQKLVATVRDKQEYLRQFWGESAFPFLFHMVKVLELFGEGAIGRERLRQLFEAVVDGYKRENPSSAPNLYFKPAEALGAAYGMVDEDLDLRQFRGHSMILRSMLEMLARREERDLVAAQWPNASRIMYHEFKMEKVEDVFAWRTPDGEDTNQWPDRTQSWKRLQDESRDRPTIPSIYADYADFLAFLILVYPHRCTPAVMRALETRIPPR